MKKMLFVLFALLSLSFNALAAVNINTASQAELESLDGIGPVKAQAIIDYRKKNGNFKTVDDLEKVDGIGAATLANVKKDVSISGATTAVATKTTDKPSKAEKPAKTAKADKAAPETAKVDDKAAAKEAKAAKKAEKEAAKKAKADAKAAKEDTKATDKKK